MVWWRLSTAGGGLGELPNRNAFHVPNGFVEVGRIRDTLATTLTASHRCVRGISPATAEADVELVDRSSRKKPLIEMLEVYLTNYVR